MNIYRLSQLFHQGFTSWEIELIMTNCILRYTHSHTHSAKLRYSTLFHHYSDLLKASVDPFCANSEPALCEPKAGVRLLLISKVQMFIVAFVHCSVHWYWVALLQLGETMSQGAAAQMDAFCYLCKGHWIALLLSSRIQNLNEELKAELGCWQKANHLKLYLCRASLG